MTLPEIHQLLPRQSPQPLDDDAVRALYAARDRRLPVVRANFVASIDGAATVGNLSGPLGGAADKRVFDLLRQLSDVIVVGAGTLRTEKYDAMRLSAGASQWRLAQGLSAQPHFAIVSARLDLDASSEVFVNAPVRPLVLTADTADPEARRRLAPVADVISCGELRAGGRGIVEALTSRGLMQLHCEGGPHLLGTLIADDMLDELCLTTSPLLEGGRGPRIAAGEMDAVSRSMSLDHVLISADVLFTKYSRIREDAPR